MHENASFLRSPPKADALLPLFAVLLSLAPPAASAAAGQYIDGNTPAFVASAAKIGRADPSERITLGLWLRPHDQPGLDAAAEDLYNPASPRYRLWLKNAEVLQRFAPSPAEARTVREFLQAKGFTGLADGPDHFYIRAQGTVAQVEKAFHVEIDAYRVAGRTFRANSSNPYIEGPAAALVQVVSGLDGATFQRTMELQPVGVASAMDPHSDKRDLSWATAKADASGFKSVCFLAPQTESFTTGGGYPKASYSGNVYYSAGAGCGYTPANIYAAYNLDGLYREGYDGAGQTIVLIEPCGSPTTVGDANTFSQRFGLPKLTRKNFGILNFPAPSTCSGYAPVINGDVEWAHAIAPGARIEVVVPPTDFVEDIDEATFYAASTGLGTVISGSYYTPEFFTGAAEARKENLISEIAAVTGIATNYASGDYSNYTYAHVPPTVSVPADLPFATGVGGVSVALKPDNSIAFQTAWENHISILMTGGTINNPSSPLNFYGFGGGAGGGPSAVFAKPSFQKALSGKFRQVPDIAWLADPLTGGLIVASQDQHFPPQIWFAAGGTELATPMFSALWAIASQEAGTPLGQAARYLYSMPSTTITDVVPQPSNHNPTAEVELSSSQAHRYDAADTLAIAAPAMFGSFYSALDVDPSGTVFDLSFGQDYYLHPAKGWDPITGLGTPNGKAFADWFAPHDGRKR